MIFKHSIVVEVHYLFALIFIVELSMLLIILLATLKN